MGFQSARRRARFAVPFIGVVIGFGVAAAPAFATASTITATTATANPEQAVPVDITISGTNNSGAAANVDVVVRPSGGLGCQSSYSDDMSAVGIENTVIDAPGTLVAPSGAYQVTASYKPPQAASYQLCAWLDPSNQGNSPLAPPATDTFAAQAPQVAQFSVTLPVPHPPTGVTFQISDVTQTDQPLSLYSVIKKTGGLPCAASFELETQQRQSEDVLSGPGSNTVFGGPTTTILEDQETAGTYVICTWIEGPNAGEVDDSNSTRVTVGTPSTTAPSAGLKLSKVTASAKHGVSVKGTTAHGLSGRLKLTAVCGSARTTATAQASGGHFSGHLRTPHGCHAGERVKATVTWTGTSAFRAGSTSKAATLKH